ETDADLEVTGALHGSFGHPADYRRANSLDDRSRRMPLCSGKGLGGCVGRPGAAFASFPASDWLRRGVLLGAADEHIGLSGKSRTSLAAPGPEGRTRIN